MHTKLAILLAASGLSLGACAYDGGYHGASLGTAGWYDADACWNYGWNGWTGWAGAYQPGYCGWYGDYFYPGTGVYVYDRSRTRHRWTTAQQHYWAPRVAQARTSVRPIGRR